MNLNVYELKIYSSVFVDEASSSITPTLGPGISFLCYESSGESSLVRWITIHPSTRRGCSDTPSSRRTVAYTHIACHTYTCGDDIMFQVTFSWASLGSMVWENSPGRLRTIWTSFRTSATLTSCLFSQMEMESSKKIMLHVNELE